MQTVLIADPPWDWKTYSAKGTKKSPQYTVASTKDICELSPTVRALAGKHSYMMLWATRPKLQDALAVLASWGYAYKTCLVWKKPNVGTGYHARDNAELVLIGTRGQPGVGIGKRSLAAFEAPRSERRHSSKPCELHSRAELQFPSFVKLELFARQRRHGWHCIGSDLGSILTPVGIVGSDAALLGHIDAQLAASQNRPRRARKNAPSPNPNHEGRGASGTDRGGPRDERSARGGA